MADETIALENSDTAEMEAEADYEAELNQQRAVLAQQQAEKERKERLLKEEGHTEEQTHVPVWEFGLVLVMLAIPNDVLDFIEIPATLSLVAAIPIKAVMLAIDFSAAVILMLWSATRLETGFFGARRIATFLGTALLEFSPLGFVPGWSLFVIFEAVMQMGREEVVKTIAKVSPEKAERAAGALKSAQSKAEAGAAKLGKSVQGSLTQSPSLRGATGVERKAALDARRRIGQDIRPQAEKQVLQPLKREFDRYAPGYADKLIKETQEKITFGSQRSAEKTGFPPPRE